jgi:tetratricopeptide (TPR) repeat protein
MLAARILAILIIFISAAPIRAVTLANPDSVKALLPQQKGKDKLGSLLLLAKHQAHSNMFASLSYSEEALSIASRLGLCAQQSQALNTMGDAHYYARLLSDADKHYKLALAAAERCNLRAEQADALANIGIVHASVGQNDEALASYRDARRLYAAAGDMQGVANIYNNIGNIFLNNADYETAAENYNKSLYYLDASGDNTSASKALNNLGNVFMSTGQSSTAAGYYSRAAERARICADSRTLAEALSNLGVAIEESGRTDSAVSCYTGSLTIYRQLGDSIGAAKSSNNLGLAYSKIGRYPQAISCLQQSVQIYAAEGDIRGQARSLHNLATVHEHLSDYSSALPYLLKALELRMAEADLIGAANTCTSIANSYSNIGDAAKAMEFYGAALNHYSATADSAGIALVLLNMGALMEIQGNLEQAARYYSQSLEIEKNQGNSHGAAHSMQNLANIYRIRGQYAEAIDMYSQAGQLAQANNQARLLMNNYRYLSESWAMVGSYKEALDFYISYSSLKDSILGEASRKKLVEMQAVYEAETKQKHIEVQDKDIQLKNAQLRNRRTWIVLLSLGAAVSVGLALALYGQYSVKLRANKLLAMRNADVEAKQKELLDSINYASRIQVALQPPQALADRLLSDYFIMNKPRNVVSGDFFWVAQRNGYTYVAAADCTGHGVPGAFMSMLGITYLNESLKIHSILEPAQILDYVRKQIVESLQQEDDTSQLKDGMDIALYRLDAANMKLCYSGAHNPLYIARKGKLMELKADSMPISIYCRMNCFAQQEVDLEKGDMIYAFSDGYIDQFGGPKGKKYLKSRFKALLASISDLPAYQQGTVLESEFAQWMGDQEQIDDIMVIGQRV